MGISPFVRILLVASTSLALPSPGVRAQRGLELGVRGGVPVAGAFLDAPQTFSRSNRTGIAGEAFLTHDAAIDGFQLGIEYPQKGADLDIEGAIHDVGLCDITKTGDVVRDLKKHNWTLQAEAGFRPGR
jgi:hypothetical protein